jgi:hypothetical protein
MRHDGRLVRVGMLHWGDECEINHAQRQRLEAQKRDDFLAQSDRKHLLVTFRHMPERVEPSIPIGGTVTMSNIEQLLRSGGGKF